MEKKGNILDILKNLVKKSPKNLKRDYETLQVRLQEVLDELRDTRTKISELEEKVQTAETERDEISSSYEGKIQKYKEEMDSKLRKIIDIEGGIVAWRLYPYHQTFTPEQLEVLNISEELSKQLYESNETIETLTEQLGEQIVDSLQLAIKLGKQIHNIKNMPIAMYMSNSVSSTPMYDKYMQRAGENINEEIKSKIKNKDYSPIETDDYKITLEPQGMKGIRSYTLVSIIPKKEERLFRNKITGVTDTLKKAWEKIHSQYKEKNLSIHEKEAIE